MHGHRRFDQPTEGDPRFGPGFAVRGDRYDRFGDITRGRGGGRGRGRGRPDGFGPGFGRHGEFGQGFGGPMFGRGPKVGRGDVRAAIIALLAEEPMHGYQIITELTERSGGVWRPSPGSVYPTLQLLQDEGLVTAAEVDGRRVFTLTASGQTEVAARREQGAVPPWVEMADDAGEPVQRMARALRSVVIASKQLLRDGSPAQQSRAESILAETRRALYALLAADDVQDPAPEEG